MSSINTLDTGDFRLGMKLGWKCKAFADLGLRSTLRILSKGLHATHRFSAIVRSEGLSAACQKALRKVITKSSRGIGPLLRPCSYFVPPPRKMHISAGEVQTRTTLDEAGA